MNPFSIIALRCLRAAALLVLAIAALKLAAWQFHWLGLLRLGAPAALMKFNTALGFVGAALALLTVPRARRRWHFILPGLVLALGVATGLEHVAGRSLGIDDLFFRLWAGDDFPPNTRMTISSALAFCCTGLALLVWFSGLRAGWRFALCSVLTAAVAVPGLMNLVGYAGNAGTAYSWSGLTGMAMVTACLFVVLALGLAAMLWHGYLADASLRLIGVPFVVLLLGMTATLIIIQSLHVSQAQAEAAAVQRDAFDFARIIQLESARDLKLITRLQARWQDGMSPGLWAQDTRVTLHDNHTIYAAELVSHGLDNTENIGLNDPGTLQTVIAQHKETLRRMKPDNRFVMAGTRDWRRLIFFIVPLSRQRSVDDYLAIAYDTQGLLNNVTSTGWNRPIRISIAGPDGTLAVYPMDAVPDPAATTRQANIAFGADQWTVQVSETLKDGAEQGVIFPVLFTGLLLSFGLAAALYQQGRLRRSGAALQETARQLRGRETDLTRLNKELEQFAYVASHDLKAPLRGIDNLAQWIFEDLPPETPEGVRQKCALMRGRVLRLEKILDDILSYARAGRIVETAVDVDTGALIQDIIADLPRVHHIYMDTYMPVIKTVRTPLLQVFQNLFGNAIKHHDQGRVAITVSAVDHGNQIEFIVSDDGPGVPDEYKANVFEMFRTLKPRDQVEGSGLGLSIVKKLVEWQEGRVWFSDRADGQRGAAVHFLWPVSPP